MAVLYNVQQDIGGFIDLLMWAAWSRALIDGKVEGRAGVCVPAKGKCSFDHGLCDGQLICLVY